MGNSEAAIERRGLLVDRYRSIRKQADDRVGSKSQILGSMIGLKQRSGEVTNRVSLQFIVPKKTPDEQLEPKERIPKTITVDGNRVGTDVIEWPDMEEQSLPKPYIIHDGLSQGTLTCFARTQLGTFGLTCGHCLLGQDGKPSTPTLVKIYHPNAGFVPAGQSIMSLFMPGSPASGQGYIDCGLFSLPPNLQTLAQSAEEIPSVPDAKTLLGQPILGYSMLKAPTSPNAPPIRKGTVIAIDQKALNAQSDLVIKVSKPGTFRGDSGMLWIDAFGRAAGIHCRGQIVPQGYGSPLTTSMLISRAAALLGVELVWGN